MFVSSAFAINEVVTSNNVNVKQMVLHDLRPEMKNLLSVLLDQKNISDDLIVAPP